MKHDDTKTLARAKRVYKTQSNWYYNKVYRFANWISGETVKRCESITEFLDNVKYAKLLKKTRVPFRSKMRQIEHHNEIKKLRASARKQILEGIQEFEERYDD